MSLHGVIVNFCRDGRLEISKVAINGVEYIDNNVSVRSFASFTGFIDDGSKGSGGSGINSNSYGSMSCPITSRHSKSGQYGSNCNK